MEFKNSIKAILKITQNYDCVILHCLSNINCSIFLLSNDKSKFIGCLWGSEFYTNIDIYKTPIFGELTKQFHQKFGKPIYKQVIKKIFPFIFKNRQNKISQTGKLITFLATSSIEELDYLKGLGFIEDRCKFFPFNYYPLEFIMKGNNDIVNDSNILIGNSASLTNNHLETIDLLLKLNVSNRKIIAPLSYGNIKYANYIQKIGEKNFNEEFIALRTFLPITEYNEIVRSCGIVIMNHYRQQAFGNVIACLWMGSKLYLSEKNIIFSYLKRLGIIIFSVENDLNPKNKNVLSNLSQEDIIHNRKILEAQVGKKKLIQDLRKAIEENFLKRV